jgi:hypothetical protein
MFFVFPILYDISLLHICSSSVNICSSIIGSCSDSYILSFLIFFPPLIFLLFEMRCKFVLARLISCSSYKYIVHAILTLYLFCSR